VAKHFEYLDNWKSAVLECSSCGWTGTFEGGSVELYNELMDSSCPTCDTMLAIVSYPLTSSSSARGEFLRKFEETKLKDKSQLPDIDDLSIILTWDFFEEGKECFTVIKNGEMDVWRELALFEGADRFKEIVKVLKKKYGSRLADVIPTAESGMYLYGDVLSSINLIKKARAAISRSRVKGNS
jgi:hypothetical protein